MAQNIGAKEPRRAKRGLVYGIAASLAVGIVIGYFAFFHGDLLAGIFVSGKDPAVIASASAAARAMILLYSARALLFASFTI